MTFHLMSEIFVTRLGGENLPVNCFRLCNLLIHTFYQLFFHERALIIHFIPYIAFKKLLSLSLIFQFLFLDLSLKTFILPFFYLLIFCFLVFTPFPIGALLGGDLNNSNGGCPSPVRKCSRACSDHVFKYLLTCCSLSMDKHSFWHLICIRVSIPKPFPFFSPSSFLLCTICDRALEGSGDATSNIHRHAWESLHLPLDMQCALCGTL